MTNEFLIKLRILNLKYPVIGIFFKSVFIILCIGLINFTFIDAHLITNITHFFKTAEESQLENIEKLLASPDPANHERAKSKLNEMILMGSDAAKLRLARIYIASPASDYYHAKKLLLQITRATPMSENFLAEIDKKLSQDSITSDELFSIVDSCDEDLLTRNKSELNFAEQLAIPLMHIYCPNMKQDLKDSLGQLEKLKEQGNLYAGFLLGKFYLEGNEVPYDPAKGKLYLENACSGKVSEACLFLKAYQENNINRIDINDKKSLLKEIENIKNQLEGVAQ